MITFGEDFRNEDEKSDGLAMEGAEDLFWMERNETHTVKNPIFLKELGREPLYSFVQDTISLQSPEDLLWFHLKRCEVDTETQHNLEVSGAMREVHQAHRTGYH